MCSGSELNEQQSLMKVCVICWFGLIYKGAFAPRKKCHNRSDYAVSGTLHFQHTHLFVHWTALSKLFRSLGLAHGETQSTGLRDCDTHPLTCGKNLLLELILVCLNTFRFRGNSQWNKIFMCYVSSCSAMYKHCFGSNFSHIYKPTVLPHNFSLFLQHFLQFLGKSKCSHFFKKIIYLF